VNPATLDDVLAAVRATTAQIVGTAETCRRLNIGKDQLAAEAEAGHIRRIPNMRGIGNGHCYHVDEIARYAAWRAGTRPLRTAAADTERGAA
jgi:hypothetical protein